MDILHAPDQLREATEDLKIIRETMERSTKHSSLSGIAGLLIGIWALGGVYATRLFAPDNAALSPYASHPIRLCEIWAVVLLLSAATDFAFNKRRASSVGKFVFSSLGARMIRAAGPSFFACFVLTLFILRIGHPEYLWGVWMSLYGIAICSVGLFSVRPVTNLGIAFLVAGAVTFALPSPVGLGMMALSFGGFHIAYGLWTGIARGDW